MLVKFFNSVIPKYLNLRCDAGKLEDTVYWSMSSSTYEAWEPLLQARKLLGEPVAHGSEPDIILVFDSQVVLIEAKFMSPAVVRTDSVPAYYMENSEHPVFNDTIKATTDCIGYELFRYFLLGEQLAKLLNRPYIVVSLTRSVGESGLEDRITPSLRSEQHCFRHITWDQVGKFAREHMDSVECAILSRYLSEKTAGYDQNGKLQLLIPDA